MVNLNAAELARELLSAKQTLTGVGTLPSARNPEFTLADAYAVEAEIARLRGAEGRKVVGRKVGYANKAVWRIMKLETLVWASMYDDTVHRDATELPASRFYSPRIEPEIVVKLAPPIGSGSDAAGVLAAVEWVALGFEIIDCPFPEWKFQPADFVAAYGLHAALVVGEQRRVDASWADSLASFKLRLLRNGQLVEEGGGKNSLRSPALCVAELARAAGGLNGGELISTGTLTNAQPIAAGEVWRAQVEGLALPDLELRFT